MTTLKNISQKLTKTIIGLTLIMGLFSTSILANTTNFESHISLEEIKNQFEISFKNADSPVKITMMEIEDGIVYNTTTSSHLFAKQFNADSLPAGEYTVIVEYKGQVVESKMFNIEASVQATLMNDEDGIVFSQRATMTNLANQISKQGLPKGNYTLLIEKEGMVETRIIEIKK
jgi:hypothetical protein